MIPADLLDKLREKDPDLWEKIAETALSEYEYHDEEFNAWISNTITYTDLFGPAQDAWLQHCLQEAIRARGWEFVLRSVTIGRTPGVEAIVYKIRGQKRGVAYTESEALCWAYLAAIEAILT